MKRLLLISALFVVTIAVAQDKKRNLTAEFNYGIGYLSYSNFKINNYFKEHQVNSFKANILNVKFNFNFYFKNNFGFYMAINSGANFLSKNSQSNSLKMFSYQYGPSYKMINKSNFALRVTPFYAYEALTGRVTFNTSSSVTSLLQTKTGNSLQFNRNTHNVGLMLSSVFLKKFTFEVGYMYNLNQSAFNVPGIGDQSILPIERNGVLMFSLMTRL